MRLGLPPLAGGSPIDGSADMIRINVEEDLAPAWRGRIEHQINRILSPVRGSLKSASVRFGASPESSSVDGAVTYLCELEGRGIRGEHYRASAQHPNGEIAVADTLARARRAVARDRQRSAFAQR